MREAFGKAFIAFGEALLRQSEKKRKLGTDWKNWPYDAQVQLLDYLRKKQAKPTTN